MKSLTLPIVHLNGTGAQTLFDGYYAASLAIDTARSALAAVEFNARDYYVVAGPDAWRSARGEREAQFAALDRIQGELTAIVLHVQDAIDARARQMEGRA